MNPLHQGRLNALANIPTLSIGIKSLQLFTDTFRDTDSIVSLSLNASRELENGVLFCLYV